MFTRNANHREVTQWQRKSGDDLRSLLTTCGLVVVTERGLSINYWSPYDDLIPSPVTIDPRMRLD